MVVCDGEILKQVQAIEIEILQEVQKICDKYNLTYFAIGGTCIGAIRHKGFIPWDDDIDIALPFKDYKILREKAEKELPPQYAIHDQYEKKEIGRIFMKVGREDTTAVKELQLRFPDSYNGVHIDIMPVYGLPEDESKYEKIFKHVLSCKLKNRLVRYPFKYFRSLSGKLAWIAATPLRLTRSFDYYCKEVDRTYGDIPFDNAKKVLFGWRPYKKNYKRSIFDYEDFKETVEVPFENITVAVPKGYDHYLKQDFGDYMKLPPKDQQIAHVWAILDLNKSYKDYIKEREN